MKGSYFTRIALKAILTHQIQAFLQNQYNLSPLAKLLNMICLFAYFNNMTKNGLLQRVKKLLTITNS